MNDAATPISIAEPDDPIGHAERMIADIELLLMHLERFGGGAGARRHQHEQLKRYRRELEDLTVATADPESV